MSNSKLIEDKCYELNPELNKNGLFVKVFEEPLKGGYTVAIYKNFDEPAKGKFYLDHVLILANPLTSSGEGRGGGGLTP